MNGSRLVRASQGGECQAVPRETAGASRIAHDRAECRGDRGIAGLSPYFRGRALRHFPLRTSLSSRGCEATADSVRYLYVAFRWRRAAYGRTQGPTAR